MIKQERISYKPARPNFAKAPPLPSNSTGNVTITMPVMIKKNANDPCEIKVHLSKGPAYVAKRNQMKPLTQLGLSFINGGQIIGLTLILTVISGVFIWILVSATIIISALYHSLVMDASERNARGCSRDRNTNTPTGLPSPFLLQKRQCLTYVDWALTEKKNSFAQCRIVTKTQWISRLPLSAVRGKAFGGLSLP